jgi:hypothetical protein
MTVADHLTPAYGIATLLVMIDPVSHLRFDGLGKHLLSALPEDVAEHILGLGHWHNPNLAGRTIHGGVLLCPRRALVRLDTPKGTPPFSFDYPQHSVIPQKEKALGISLFVSFPFSVGDGKFDNRF